MAPAKQTLGYPSRTAAVVALTEKKIPDGEIARRIGIEVSTVAALRCSARRKRPAEENGRTVLFPNDLLDAIRSDAERRGISANELARRIVQVTADDGLIDALLDDEHELSNGN